MNAYSLLNVFLFHPDVGDHDSGAVPSDGVLEDVGQLGLAIGNVVTIMLRQSQGHLLQERQGLVDELGLVLSIPNRLWV